MPKQSKNTSQHSKSPLARMAERLNSHLRDSGYTVTEAEAAFPLGKAVATFVPRHRKKPHRKTKKKSD